MIADIPPRPSSIVVFTPVGCTVLTRMFRSASSLASDLATPTTQVFAATYGAKNGRPFRPAVELVMMIDPPPAAGGGGNAATHVFLTPVRLISMVSCQISGVTSCHSWSVQMPALADTMS